MDLTDKDIVVFPDIAGSYAIRNKYHNTTTFNEWFIFGWEGYKIGTYYSGTLYTPSQHDSFDERQKREFPNMKSAVVYAWLMASQRLLQNNKQHLDKECLVVSKYGIRAFMNGACENCVYSLFNSKDQFVGDIINDDGFFVGRKVGFKNHLDEVPFSRRNKDGVLKTLMYCCGFGSGY